MSGRADEEVDAFGRTIISKGRFPETADNRPNRNVEFNQNNQNRNNFDEGDKRSDYGNKRNNRYPSDFRDDRKGDWNSRERDGGSRADRPYNSYSDSQQAPRRRPASPPRNELVVPSSTRVPPIMSFKSFMQTQREDHTVEVFQRMYEEYHIHYLGDFSSSFFRASMGEEWFQDRYNPINIQELESESAVWAAKEGAALKSLLLSNPAEAVRSMCLDPSSAQNRFGRFSSGQRSIKNEVAGKEEAAEGRETKDTDMDFLSLGTAKHLSGHEHRTIYLSGVHACCTKAVLRNAIIEAIATSIPPVDNTATAATVDIEPIPAPERIVIAQPVWSHKFLEKFERSAWVVMPTVASARQAVAVLKDLMVSVPGPVDPLTGEKHPLFTFTMQANTHIPRVNLHTVPEYFSHPTRVQADTDRALLLAGLLDEDRSVPSEARLESILAEQSIVSAFAKPTDRLDVAIGYLRRVHFVAFYGAKRYRDEAHLLAFAASPILRVRPCVESQATLPLNFVPAPPSEPRPSDAVDGKAESASVGSKRKFSEDGEEPVPATATNEEKESAVAMEMASSAEVVEAVVTEGEGVASEEGEEIEVAAAVVETTSSAVAKPAAVRGIPGVPLSDRRIESIIADLRAKRNAVETAKKAGISVALSTSSDATDAQALLAIQEKSYMQCVEAQCRVEKDSKARCCYGFCKKLFKDLDFLSKHLRAKHDDFAQDVLLRDAEPFMLKRFESEDISARPLPPVEVESHGAIELKSVKEILDKYYATHHQPQQQSQGGGNRDNYRSGNAHHNDRRHNSDRNYDRDHESVGSRDQSRRWSGANGHRDRGDRDNNQQQGGNRRGGDERDRRSTFGGSSSSGAHNTNDQQQQRQQYVAPRSEDNYSRKISSYLDVDAPKESVVSIDYGVALLPPVKKRKTAVTPKKTAPAAETAPSAVADPAA